MYGEREWRTVRRLRADGAAQVEIARELKMSRTTVRRLLQLECPPRYERSAGIGPIVDAGADRNLRLLACALLATARDMLERERLVSGLETVTVQVSALGAKSGHPPVDET